MQKSPYFHFFRFRKIPFRFVPEGNFNPLISVQRLFKISKGFVGFETGGLVADKVIDCGFKIF
jgi:hypothetical protein